MDDTQNETDTEVNDPKAALIKEVRNFVLNTRVCSNYMITPPQPSSLFTTADSGKGGKEEPCAHFRHPPICRLFGKTV